MTSTGLAATRSTRSRQGAEERLRTRLAALYPSDPDLAARIIASAHARRREEVGRELDHTDAFLICYADHVSAEGETPLRSLKRVVDGAMAGAVKGIHLLPFTPATSDGGYAVSDYAHVAPAFGDWQDIAELAENHTLMFDCVLNHTSASHEWFRGFLDGDPRYANFYITADPEFDTSEVVRPRATPLFTTFQSQDGPVDVWTTFGADQPDLNYRCPDVFEAAADVVTNFVARGARVLRFDATHFLWKESGTTCVSLPQAHVIIKALRDVLDIVDPSVIIINETNIPHSENITYFGDGHDEAQLVYNFALPSLLVQALHTGDATTLTDWARGLETPSEETHFFNYTACHDGISVRGSAEILTAEQRRTMIQRSIEHGGRILYRSTPTGDVPYEMCITYFDALSPSHRDPYSIDRFIVSQAIAMALAGVPAIYFSSLFGAHSWQDGPVISGVARDVNREKYTYSRVINELHGEGRKSAAVFAAMARLLRARTSCAAFHPKASQAVMDFGPGVFALHRRSQDGNDSVLAIHNMTAEPLTASMGTSTFVDILTGDRHIGAVLLEPYGVAWLREESAER